MFPLSSGWYSLPYHSPIHIFCVDHKHTTPHIFLCNMVHIKVSSSFVFTLAGAAIAPVAGLPLPMEAWQAVAGSSSSSHQAVAGSSSHHIVGGSRSESPPPIGINPQWWVILIICSIINPQWSYLTLSRICAIQDLRATRSWFQVVSSSISYTYNKDLPWIANHQVQILIPSRESQHIISTLKLSDFFAP